MGYLSCKAESSTSIASSTSPNSSSHHHRSHKGKEEKKKKPIKIQEFNYKDLELATDNFSHTNLLGRGSHGLVYKAVLRGGRLVAVKKPSRKTEISITQNPNEVDNEIDILSELQGPRFVNLVGFTNNASRDRLLVVEFMSNGTLYDTLHSSSRPLSWGRRIKLASQIAKAIETLHSSSPPIIHRDIKSANVLIDRNSNARLGDFGLALRCADDDYRLRSTPPAGTMGYLDPCYVTPDNLSTKTDVFSFGILLLEIISGRKAIDMGNSPPSIVDWAIPLIRRGKVLAVYDSRILPPKDAVVRKMLAVLAAKCVRSSRERRPSMKEVVECLSELSKLAPSHSWNGLANPCLMVENVGTPVKSKGRIDSENDGDAKVGTPLRVYSDLGFRSNLMELMASPDGKGDELEAAKMVSSLRLEIGRLAGRTSIRSMVLGVGKDRLSNLKPKQCVAVESSDGFCDVRDEITRSGSVTRVAKLVTTT